MKSLVQTDACVTLVTAQPVHDDAIEWLKGVNVTTLPNGSTAHTSEGDDHSSEGNERTWMRRRLSDYWGYEGSIHQQLTEFARDQKVDAVVAVGLETLPYLDSNLPIKKIWYPADDPTLHAASLIRRHGVTATAVRGAIINVAYQRAFRTKIDAAWLVSRRDRRWMQRTVGIRQLDVIPNGVDAEYYQPNATVPQSDSCIFWGRLDFDPNVDALVWFLDRVWQNVLDQRPAATFHVCGSHPRESLKRLLEKTRGVKFHENLDDLRPLINAAAVCVFPMVSGAGVKNKVLEAAAMAKPVCCTALCLNGLRTHGSPPLILADRPADWSAAILNLWDDPFRRQQFGRAARQWVQEHHSWDQSAVAAREAIQCLDK